MWTKSAKLLMVRVKVQKRRGFLIPIPIWVIDEFLEALADLAWVGELVLNRIPLPRDEKARKHQSWIKTCSPSGIIIVSHNMIKDLSRYKGLDVVDMNTGEVQVKVSIK
ncbi:MAG: hypothetical protein P4L69_10170 [Desulfosporosinus sp.]|nr:hypothetical protein [Desulfosporosinus sp.]